MVTGPLSEDLRHIPGAALIRILISAPGPLPHSLPLFSDLAYSPSRRRKSPPVLGREKAILILLKRVVLLTPTGGGLAAGCSWCQQSPQQQAGCQESCRTLDSAKGQQATQRPWQRRRHSEEPPQPWREDLGGSIPCCKREKEPQGHKFSHKAADWALCLPETGTEEGLKATIAQTSNLSRTNSLLPPPRFPCCLGQDNTSEMGTLLCTNGQQLTELSQASPVPGYPSAPACL